MDVDLTKLPGYVTSRLAFYAMNEQAHAGVQFDQEAARALVERIGTWMRSIEEEVEPRLPPRKLKAAERKEFTIPAKPFKKDGTLSAVMTKWMEKHKIRALRRFDGVMFVEWIDGEEWLIEGGKELPATMPMTLGNQEDVKTFLIESGWSPSIYNFKKDERGKPVRDDRGRLIQTSPRMQEQGRLCPNLERLEGELAKKIVLWLSLRNRKSVVEGWLENDRLPYDGRLSAAASGLTPTYRWRHSVITNLPKADPSVVLGKEMRQLFTARPGRMLVGYDASGLEARAEAHWCYKLEGGKEYADVMLANDIHMETAKRMFFDKIGHLYGTDRWHKEDPEVKTWRSKSKTLRYGIGFGAGSAKVASMLGVSKQEAEEVLETYWAAAQPAALLKKKLVQFWETTGEKKWIKGIDGRRVRTRSEHALINTLFQSTGAIVMEIAGVFMEKWLGGWTTDEDGYPCFKYKGQVVYRVCFFHDEYEWDCTEELADEIGRMGCESIKKAGEYLKMNVPLVGEYQPGRTLADVH